MGWFEPTEIGERLMPALTTLGVYHDEISREMSNGSLPSGEPISGERRKALARKALEYKVTDEAGQALDALQLELRDAEGNVIPTESIALQDTEYLMALCGDADDLEELHDADDVEEDDDHGDEPTPDEFSSALMELGIEEELTFPDDWSAGECDWGPSTLPRYQIFVDLVDGRAIPVSDRWKDDPYVQALVAGRDPREALRDLEDDG